MMKHEFEERLGHEVSDKEYKVIEHVYNWHPTFDTMADPKQGIADLYKDYGMGLINCLVEAADAACALASLEHRALSKLQKIRERKKYVAAGDLSIEKSIALIDHEVASSTPEEAKAFIDSFNNHEAVELGDYNSMFL